MNEILNIANKVVNAYDFTDFESVYLYNLDNDNSLFVEKSELNKYAEDEEKPRGNFHIISFNPGDDDSKESLKINSKKSTSTGPYGF